MLEHLSAGPTRPSPSLEGHESMKSLSSSFACVKQASEKSDLEDWAARVVADPSAHFATPREAAIIGELAAQLGGTR